VTSEGSATGPTASHRARAPRRALTLVLAVLLLVAGALAGYLWRVAEAWQERDSAWAERSGALSASLAAERGELEDTRAELEVVRAQLARAQERITELADEKARLGDEHAVVRQLAEYQDRVQEAAAAVVEALDACIASQQRLVRWLETAPEEDPDLRAREELATTAREVCGAAQEAKEALEEELGG